MTATNPKPEHRSERRKNTRYHELGVELSVARRGIVGFLRLNPSADCIDFSVSGLQFCTDQRFKVDEKLVLDLRVRDIEATELNAVVVSSEPMTEEGQLGKYCTRVRFCFMERRMKKPRIMHALLSMEERLRVARQYPD